MKFAMKSIVAAAALAVAGVAGAATVTVPSDTAYNGLSFSGAGTLTFSQDLVDAFNVGTISASAYGAATPQITTATDGSYVSVAVSAPITSLNIDDSTMNVVSAQTAGGLKMVSPALGGVSTGGNLIVTDLNVDLVNKAVYATLIGGNGVGTLNNVEVWTINSITGGTTVNGAGSYNNSITGLSITTAARNDFIQALGLVKFGTTALNSVTDFGTIQSTITATAAVPEPSSYALMALGLAGVGLVARRRRAQ